MDTASLNPSISSTNSNSTSGTNATNTGTRNVMKWTDGKDMTLMGEVTLVNPYQFRKGSAERGKAWSPVAENLNKNYDDFKVDQRSVRERVSSLMAKTARRNAAEKRASGIAPEETESEKKMTEMVEDLIQQDQDSENLPTGKTAMDEQLKKDGAEMRKRSCEMFGETNKRLKEGDSQRKMRNSGSDATKFMLQKLELDREIRRDEMELKRKEIERKEKAEEERKKENAERDRRFELMQQQHQQQMEQMHQHFLQSQTNTQNMMLMLLQNMNKGNK